MKEKEIDAKKDNAIEVYNLIRDKRSKINSFSSFKENINKRIIQVEGEIQSLLGNKKRDRELLKGIEDEENEKKGRDN